MWMIASRFLWDRIAHALPWLILSVAIIGAYWWQARWHYQRGANAVQARWDAAELDREREHRAEVERLLAAAAERQAADMARQQAMAQYLAAERAETERLRAALSRAQLVTRPEPTDADPDPDPRLSEPFRLCWNAHWTGDPADRAACQAAGRALSGPSGR